MSETPEDVAACTSRDCQFVHDHTRPTPEDVYRAAAEANDLVRPGRITVYTDVLATDPSFRAGVDAAYAAGHVDGAVAERGRITRIIRRHANSAGLPLSTSNALSRIVDEMEGPGA